MILMGLSNEHGHLVLTTGNKSELATGYSTLYGDSAGGFAPIKDVLKTMVWRAVPVAQRARRRAVAQTPPIPENSITKEPSAELRPDQRDTDSLPPYEVLDRLLDDYVEKDMGCGELIAAGHDPDLVTRVIRLVDLAEYKRRQYPPGPKITAEELRPRPPPPHHQPLAGRPADLATPDGRRGRRHGEMAGRGVGRRPSAISASRRSSPVMVRRTTIRRPGRQADRRACAHLMCASSPRTASRSRSRRRGPACSSPGGDARAPACRAWPPCAARWRASRKRSDQPRVAARPRSSRCSSRSGRGGGPTSLRIDVE